MFESTQSGIGLAAMACTLAFAAWGDWKRWRISNALLASSALTALCLATLISPGIGVSGCLLGGLTGIALFLPHYLMRGMAAGDVKLLGVIGMYAGPQMTVEIALVSALVGGLWACVVIARRKMSALAPADADRGSVQQDRRRQAALQHYSGEPLIAKEPGRLQAIPYGVVMAIGTAIVVAAAEVWPGG